MPEDVGEDDFTYPEADDAALPPALQELATHVHNSTTLRELSGLLRAHPLPLIVPSSSGFKYHVMISYCVQDKEVATTVAGYLKDNGFNVWIDTSKTHDLINQAVLDAIQDSRVIMPFLSDAYVGSRNCKLELVYALSQRQKVFLPVRLSSAPVAVVFGAGTSIINLNQDVWQNSSARAAALSNIILNLPDRRENLVVIRLTKPKYYLQLWVAITVIIILLIVAVALAVHFIESKNDGGSGDSSSVTSSSSSTTTSSVSFGGTTITLPTYFQIQKSGTDSCIVPSASGASYATCETSPASDSTQVLTAPNGNGGNWKHTSTGECLSFFSTSDYLTLATCSSTNTFQELTIVETTISDGFSTCLPDNLQTLGGSGCGSFTIVQVAA
ncbi:cytokinesis protein 3 [Cladochytrium tenue]|nr:cytokinesis protein 3 [Cladochytrium tenue]